MDFEGFPLIVGWELTLACNLRCAHCGSSAGRPRADELTTAEALAVCDQLPDLLVFEVDFTGGEPLVRDDWFAIAVRLRALGIRTKLVTNGLLLTSETVARLKEAGIERVGVSIDGLAPTHDHIRKRPGLFAHILSATERLVAAGIPVSAVTTVNALNIGQLPALHRVLRSAGVDIWQFQPLFPLGRAQGCTELSLSEADYLRLGSFYAEAAGDGQAPTISPGDSFGYFTEMDRRSPPWGGCSAGLDLCGIMSDGRVKGCLSMPDEFAEGDLRRRDLWEIWFDPHAFHYNRGFAPADLGDACRGCPKGESCRGGCTSMSYACTGRPHGDPLCLTSIRSRVAQPRAVATAAAASGADPGGAEEVGGG